MLRQEKTTEKVLLQAGDNLDGVDCSPLESDSLAIRKAKMDGPTVKALKDYFDEWGKDDPTLIKSRID